MAEKTIAALQLGADPDGTAATLQRLLAFEHDVKAADCDLLVLPEALLGGYPKGSDFGTRVGYRLDRGREEFLQYFRQAVDLDGPEVATLCEFARSCSTAVVAGVIERAGSTLYCTALFIAQSGELAAKHRKLVPTAAERLIWGMGDGSTLPVVETGAGKVGAAICWENYMPLLRAAMYGKGLDIWCAPTVDDRDIWQTSMRHIAYEGRCFVVSACQYQPVPEPGAARDENWPKGKPLIRGGSVIVSPMGEVLQGPLYDVEGLVTVRIDPDDVIRARYDLDAAGHYARPDVFRLTVDEQERPPCSFSKLEDPD
ncbi:MAG: carbon-nitrogen hydrolase family protein [Lysobacterales bacterium]|jgi:nitrilase